MKLIDHQHLYKIELTHDELLELRFQVERAMRYHSEGAGKYPIISDQRRIDHLESHKIATRLFHDLSMMAGCSTQTVDCKGPF